MSTELSSAEPCPPTTERSRTLKEKDWEPFKSCIIDMHITRDLSLEEVRRHLKATHGFDATLRQYRTRISKWELDKKVKAKERRFIIRKHLQPGPRFAFKVRGKPISEGKIDRWIRDEVAANTLETSGEAGATPPAVSYEIAAEGASSIPVLNSPILAPTAEGTLGGMDTTSLTTTAPEPGFDLAVLGTIDEGNSVAGMALLGPFMADQEMAASMNVGPSDPGVNVDWLTWMSETPTPLVGNAYFLKDSPPPLLPQCFDNELLLQIPLLSDFQGPTSTLQPSASNLDPWTTNVGSNLSSLGSDIGVALSEPKSRELFELIDSDVFKVTHDGELGPFTAHARRTFLVGDRKDQDHPLSRTMMQTYLLSYWEQFSDQIPILHRPTFSPDAAPAILLVAMLAIGAATFGTKHSSRATTAGMGLPNYLAWGVKWEMFRDRNFRAPASLWALQASILLEIYETLYSTGELHERAVIHHPSTIHLVRWGWSLVGTAGDTKLWTAASTSAPETGNAVDDWWRRWIQMEATRRLAFATFVVDSMHSTIFGNSSIMTSNEVCIPLPCDDELWKAASGAEVRKSMTPSMAAGTEPIKFLEALQRTIDGESVHTNSFGRKILLAGLLNVYIHRTSRDQLDRGIGNIEYSAAGGGWRLEVVKAVDSWKHDLEWARLPGSESWPTALVAKCADSNIAFLHQLAHVAIHVDLLDCQILSGAKKLLGRRVGADSRRKAEANMKAWAQSVKGRDAAFHALCFLRSVLVPGADGAEPLNYGSGPQPTYSARTDALIYRPWVVYLSALVVWSYGFALEGPCGVLLPLSNQERAEAAVAYLKRYGGLPSPVSLATLKGLNHNTPVLEVLKEAFSTTSWEFLRESSTQLLSNCIQFNSGRTPSSLS